ncbi:hypothetical protein [Nitrosophilus labii]|uniref:hypothetical protein n=1 Tax=Nitrosophilus labii TaxID=2706014 RepID=UPI001656C856|nr:hypothetical protein [Nitrosophilus labii]
MRILLTFLLTIYVFAKDFSKIREENIIQINSIMEIYQKRLECLKLEDAKKCIKKYPLNQKSDQLSLLICNTFPKTYYKNILKRDLKMLKKEKMCWGKAMSKEEALECFKK